MNPIDPFTYIFEAASTLTGGIITDLKTGFLAMLVIMFILMGLDLLMGVLGTLTTQFSHKRHTSLARNLREERDSYSKDSFDYELLNASYRKNLRKSLDSFDERKYR